MAYSPTIALSQNDLTSTNDSGSLQAIVTLLAEIKSKLPYSDPATQRSRVQIESLLGALALPVTIAATQATSVSQINGVAAVTGPGPALGAAALRIAPSNETQAGLPATMAQASLATIYSNIVTS